MSLLCFLKGVFSGAGQLLKQNGVLVAYGVCTGNK